MLSAKAGTPLAEIEALVAAKGQQLAFEPMDYGPLLGGAAGRGTIGGALAANLSGPRRIKAGAARDHFLGVTAVSGRGETFKSGGRVVKNVTGYDLCKLIAGSWGTLAAMTEVTIKTLPRPETEADAAGARARRRARAVEAMTAAMGSSCDVSGAAHLPAAVAARIPLGGVAGAGTRGDGAAARRRRAVGRAPRRTLRGAAEAVRRAAERRRGGLARALARGPRRHAVRRQPAGGATRPLWRISTAPTAGAELAALVATRAERAGALRLGRRPDLARARRPATTPAPRWCARAVAATAAATRR